MCGFERAEGGRMLSLGGEVEVVQEAVGHVQEEVDHAIEVAEVVRVWHLGLGVARAEGAHHADLVSMSPVRVQAHRHPVVFRVGAQDEVVAFKVLGHELPSLSCQDNSSLLCSRLHSSIWRVADVTLTGTANSSGVALHQLVQPFCFEEMTKNALRGW
eukprot:CAMPEP_0196664160 /NCGR_PEP_ID=MMETSP1086-20130531/55982_1 /TAXON_ID=77921 /ORGANISM="Cyanoptyche  gloeocystis , Strain SAG4.97" /LENGTH=157 /DNA_ID=CAMNT_0042000333 /DNA_START=648 /DNA_END=1118 /DNA_ORIENTATION=-